MYELNASKIGEAIKLYRKKSKLSLEDVGTKIFKTKATISKYEKGEIIPDILTLLELCNILNIKISQILSFVEEKNMKLSNPFKTNEVYLYYMTNKKLITSLINIIETENKYKILFYNDIKLKKEDCAYMYEGELKFDSSTMYMLFDNINSTSSKLEIVQLIIPQLLNTNYGISKCLITGLTPNFLPVIKKALISTHVLSSEELKLNENNLSITKQDTKDFLDEGMWILKHKNYYEF